MNTRKRNYAASMLGIGMLTVSQAAWSLGLGDAAVQSFLDQPLEVEISLLTQASDDLDAISAGLASAADYELIGASRNDISVPLSFAVEGSAGDASIVVRSQLPIKSPVVRLIVEVNSASGRMLREYTLFLDPATFSSPAPAPAPSPSVEPERSAPLPRTGDTTDSSSPDTSSQERQSAPRGSFNGSDEYGPVQSGETLWRIAKEWSDGTDISINQAMVAIQRNNPQAFSKGNINLLQRGAILRMPAVEEVSAISASEANSEVREQTNEFQMRRDVTSAATPLLVDENTAPQTAPESPPVPETAAEDLAAVESESTDEAISESAAEETTAAEAAEAAAAEQAEAEETFASENMPLDFEPQLELVPPSEESALETGSGADEMESDPAASAPERDLTEELARKEEELINQQQRNIHLEERLKELETQVAEANKGSVEDSNLASMEDRLQAEREARQAEQDKPWYSGLTLWWLGLLVIIAGLAGWFMSRRGGAGPEIAAGDALRDIQDEAKEVLRVLDADEAATPVEETAEMPAVDGDDTDETVIAPTAEKEKSKFGQSQDEAEVLDEESADPEIQLDLARAYISMGDKEAARVILDEVVTHGSDAQKAEATKMKNLL